MTAAYQKKSSPILVQARVVQQLVASNSALTHLSTQSLLWYVYLISSKLYSFEEYSHPPFLSSNVCNLFVLLNAAHIAP